MVLVRRALKYAWIYFLYATGLLWLVRQRAARRGAIAVLTLHRVLPEEEFSRTSSLPGIVVRERTFSELTDYLRRRCTAVSLNTDLWDLFPKDRPRVLLTFDDGWADNAVTAAPIAARNGVPMLIFVCPGLMGTPFPFWPERVIAARRRVNHCSPDSLEDYVEELKSTDPAARDTLLSTLEAPTEEDLRTEPLNATFDWNVLRELQVAGVSFGSHTTSHQILTQIAPSELSSEVFQSKRCIEMRLNGGSCDTFAYPNGNCSSIVREAVATSGYRFAFTTEPGLWLRSCDALQIPRVNISESRITGPLGRFSRAVFEYYTFWCTR